MLPSDPPFLPRVNMLETARLSIRIDTEQEYLEKFRHGSDAELKQYFGFPTDEALAQQRAKTLGGFSTYRSTILFFHLIERRLEKVIGSFAFHNWYPLHRRTELGYAMLSNEHKQQGYMSEAIRPIVAFGFDEMNLNRMEAFIAPENMPSRRLVEGMGFRCEGRLAEHWCYNGIMSDSLVYGLLQKDYRAAQASIS